MRKAILVVAVGSVSWSVLAAETSKPIPKEGTYSGISAFSTTVKALPLGKDRVQFTYEVMGVLIDDTGEGILHNTSLRCVGGLHAVNGAFEDDSGSCVCTRPDGDQVFVTYKAAGKIGVGAKVTLAFVGGTGKMAGITGGGEGTRTYVRSAAEGTSQGYQRLKISYKLP